MSRNLVGGAILCTHHGGFIHGTPALVRRPLTLGHVLYLAAEVRFVHFDWPIHQERFPEEALTDTLHEEPSRFLRNA